MAVAFRLSGFNCEARREQTTTLARIPGSALSDHCRALTGLNAPRPVIYTLHSKAADKGGEERGLRRRCESCRRVGGLARGSFVEWQPVFLFGDA